MIPNNFTYIKASSVAEALAALNEHGDDARLLAGGHSLIPALKLRLNEYSHLVDISKIAELKQISEENGHIVIGSMATHAEVLNSPLIQEKLGFYSEAADLIGDVQVRNAGTIGGSIAHADPAADWPALLLASNASVQVQGAGGSREISADDFFHGLYSTALEDGEIITAVSIPIRTGSRSKYVKFMQPASRFAIVGCAVMVNGNGTIADARVAFTGVSSKPFRDTAVEDALKGRSLDAGTIEEVARLAAEGVSVMSDSYASENYRKQMAKVYCKRALAGLS